MENQTNSLAVVMPNIFNGVDFSSLNATIEQLANSSKELSGEEKQLAVGVIDNWEKSVVKRLHDRAAEMSTFIHFFDDGNRGFSYGYGTIRNSSYGYGANYNSSIDEDMQEDIANSTGTVETYKAYADALAELRVLNQNTPQKPMVGPDVTLEQKFKADRDYDLAQHLHSLNCQRLQAKVNAKEKAWKAELRENIQIQDAIKKARKYNKNLNKLINECEDKTNLAKISVSISSMDVRKSLKEMLEFTKTI